jgi:uncharacterized protein (DUF433 family)
MFRSFIALAASLALWSTAADARGRDHSSSSSSASHRTATNHRTHHSERADRQKAHAKKKRDPAQRRSFMRATSMPRRSRQGQHDAVPRLRRRSREGAEARRRGPAVEHGLANGRRGEGEGPVGVGAEFRPSTARHSAALPVDVLWPSLRTCVQSVERVTRLLSAFSADQVSRLTGVSSGQLRHWHATRFLGPDEIREGAYGRTYSFRNLVELRALGILRNERRIPLQKLRRAEQYLRAHHDRPWSGLRLAVAGKELIFWDPDGRRWLSTLPHDQTLLSIVELSEVADDIQRKAEQLRHRKHEDVGRISKSRFVAANANVLQGTRVPTETIWRFHKQGLSDEDIIREYPSLRPADVHAAISFERSNARRRKQRKTA